jgi:predicted RNA-binding Zn ribbon-like protein
MMSVMDESNQVAPGPLELVRDFINTLDVEHAADELSSADAAAAWLRAHDLPGGEPPLERAQLARLIAVREALRELALANNSGDPAPEPALAALNDESSKAAIGLRFTGRGADLVTRCEGIDATIANLLAIVAEAMADDSWRRLKACSADDCRWAFYDHSRNRSGTWCEMGDCGNRAKARAYRERHRHGSGR